MRSRPDAHGRLQGAILRRRHRQRRIRSQRHLCPPRQPDPEGQGSQSPLSRCLRQCGHRARQAHPVPGKNLRALSAQHLAAHPRAQGRGRENPERPARPGCGHVFQGIRRRRFHMGSRHLHGGSKGLSDCRQLPGLRHPPAYSSVGRPRVRRQEPRTGAGFPARLPPRRRRHAQRRLRCVRAGIYPLQ